MSDINDIPGVGPAIALGLADIGITTTQELSSADVATLTKVRGISEARAERFIAVAKMVLVSPEMPETAPVTPKEAKENKPSKDTSKSKKEGSKKGKKSNKKKKDKKSDKSGADKKPKKGKKKK